MYIVYYAAKSPQHNTAIVFKGTDRFDMMTYVQYTVFRSG